MKSELLSDREIRIYSNQIQLPTVGLKGQEMYKKAHVLVIGAGGKGTSVLQILAASGVGFLGITDSFVVEENSLPKQCLYGDSDLGKQKAIVSKQRISEINHLVAYEIHNIYLSKSNIINIIKNYDVIVDTTDNFQTHYLINDACISLNKPVVYGSVMDSSGLVTIFNYEGGPSLRCLYPQFQANDEKSDSPGICAIGLLYHITATFVCNEVLKIIQGLKSQLNGNLLIFSIVDYSLSLKPIIRNEDNFKNQVFG